MRTLVLFKPTLSGHCFFFCGSLFLKKNGSVQDAFASMAKLGRSGKVSRHLFEMNFPKLVGWKTVDRAHRSCMLTCWGILDQDRSGTLEIDEVRHVIETLEVPQTLAMQPNKAQLSPRGNTGTRTSISIANGTGPQLPLVKKQDRQTPEISRRASFSEAQSPALAGQDPETSPSRRQAMRRHSTL